MMDAFKLILPIGDIPDGSTITKRNGEKTYRVTRELTIYGEDGEKQSIPCGPGAVWIVSENNPSVFNAIGDHIEVVWNLSRWQLEEFLEGPRK